MNLVQGAAMVVQTGVVGVSLSVIAGFPRGRRASRSRALVPVRPTVVSGPCPYCDGTLTAPTTPDPRGARWTTPCTGCGLRLVGVLDPARSGAETVWFQVPPTPETV